MFWNFSLQKIYKRIKLSFSNITHNSKQSSLATTCPPWRSSHGGWIPTSSTETYWLDRSPPCSVPPTQQQPWSGTRQDARGTCWSFTSTSSLQNTSLQRRPAPSWENQGRVRLTGRSKNLGCSLYHPPSAVLPPLPQRSPGLQVPATTRGRASSHLLTQEWFAMDSFKTYINNYQYFLLLHSQRVGLGILTGTK